ncbi:valine--tRNA ligase [Iodidimonas sp. SYSU 1G8]|uniref:valine--tRNA ligase n=1 Tax=Iodidimonas sp. SYSU 1G8 TaxID=3133967 RepID=UPI0031FEE633
MLDKVFRPAEVEPEIYAEWEKADAFACGKRPDADPYTIVIPPPNVTGSLHMGHALNNTLQDVLVRFERMRGRDVLWQPGTDHAGIATQMVVERQLAEQGNIRRQDLGRDEFLKRVWTWKEESGGTIINQLRRLGASCDWSRERFTMDEGLSKAVLKVFVEWYRAGLIYKDKRLVNWDPKFATAISDLEVEPREIKGHLWHFRYPIAGEPGRFIVVATTRPETMLGDTAVAVHPDDERYRDLIGKMVDLPLTGRQIPIIADLYADPETGSGAVKITPAHDFNDFEVGRRNSLPMINILDAAAHLNENVPEAYRGMERFKARAKVVEDLDALGLLEKIEDHVHMVPHGDRSGVVIEPWLTDQWYVDAATLAKPALAAVETGQTVFVPRNWEKTYFEWLRNIQPWCISRQLWWGHQIPAWYGPDGKVFVAETEDDAAAEARAHYGTNETLTRDEDVLDTWFSSQLWPFSTLGWPKQTPEVKRHYKTDVLVTGFDIIFFWVARMMMSGIYFMQDVPFHTVYIHALVRDEKGQKMSKSKGNVIDPLQLIDEYGADALRFTLTAMAAQGRDIKLSKQRVEGYRNFGTKLWNAYRYCGMNDALAVGGFEPSGATQPVNRWLAAKVAATTAAVTEALEAYRFNEAAGALYQFVWGDFCDWYLEFTKPLLGGADEAVKAETRGMTAWAMEQILRLLHPFMPFITEYLWRQTHDDLLILADWPAPRTDLVDAASSREIEGVIDLITRVRVVRTEMNVPPGARIAVAVQQSETAAFATLLDETAVLQPVIARLARIERVDTVAEFPQGTVQIAIGDSTLGLLLAGVIDVAAEKARLLKEIDKASKEVASLDGRLNNPGFVAKAPEAVVIEQRERREEMTQLVATLKDAIARLDALA